LPSCHDGAPVAQQRPRRPLGVARGTKLPAFQTVERSLGRKETESAHVLCDDTCGPVVDFNDVGLGDVGLGHDCFVRRRDGAPVWLSRFHGCLAQGSTTGAGRRREAPPRHALAHITRCWCSIRSHAASLGRAISAHTISGDRSNASMKWIFNLRGRKRVRCHARDQT
jgi:hypothetical protein